MQGIDVEYSLNSDYFKVGCAYEMKLGTNDYRVGLLTKYTKESVTFKILEKGNLVDLTLTVDNLRFHDYGLIKMTPDYKDGEFSIE